MQSAPVHDHAHHYHDHDQADHDHGWAPWRYVVILVPIIEELFWRAWGLRWTANPDFESMPIGSYTTQSFWMIAVLFASVHGPYWEVGLICGVIYNWWMGKTRSLGDLILTHAVTNGVLSAYVLAAGKWQYWM